MTMLSHDEYVDRYAKHLLTLFSPEQLDDAETDYACALDCAENSWLNGNMTNPEDDAEEERSHWFDDYCVDDLIDYDICEGC